MQYNTADQPDFNCISKQLNWNFPQRDNEDGGLHRTATPSGNKEDKNNKTKITRRCPAVSRWQIYG